jgi:hypothetical protein
MKVPSEEIEHAREALEETAGGAGIAGIRINVGPGNLPFPISIWSRLLEKGMEHPDLSKNEPTSAE